MWKDTKDSRAIGELLRDLCKQFLSQLTVVYDAILPEKVGGSSTR